MWNLIFLLFNYSISNLYDTADYMYIIPPYRFTVYAIGLLLGYFLRQYKNLKLTNLQLKAGWFINTILFLLVLAGTASMSVSDYKYNPTHAAVYAAIAPIPWCLFFAWIIITSQLGYKSKYQNNMYISNYN